MTNTYFGLFFVLGVAIKIVNLKIKNYEFNT